MQEIAAGRGLYLLRHDPALLHADAPPGGGGGGGEVRGGVPGVMSSTATWVLMRQTSSLPCICSHASPSFLQNGSVWVPHELLDLQGYHLLAMGLFLPALFLDPPFLALALSIALALLILIEAIRVAQLPYLGESFPDSPPHARMMCPLTTDTVLAANASMRQSILCLYCGCVYGAYHRSRTQKPFNCGQVLQCRLWPHVPSRLAECYRKRADAAPLLSNFLHPG